MRAKFGSDPTAGSKNLSFKFISRLNALSWQWNLLQDKFNNEKVTELEIKCKNIYIGIFSLYLSVQNEVIYSILSVTIYES